MTGIGFDTLPEKLGLAGVFAGGMQPSRLVSMLVLFFAMLFATVEAANRLEFTQVRDVVTLFIKFGGNVLLGAMILTIGFWLANVAHNAIRRADTTHSEGLASIARVAILGLVIAMGLRAMGIADDIVNLAFLLTFGAVAVAVALSFGLGRPRGCRKADGVLAGEVAQGRLSAAVGSTADARRRRRGGKVSVRQDGVRCRLSTRKEWT